MKTYAIILSALFALALGPSLASAEGTAVPKKTQGPGEGGDSTLPAGYKGIVWGAHPNAVQALRGRPLERQITTSSHVVYLIEAPLPGDKSTKKVIKWKFWDEALIEVQVHYEGPFTRTESRELVYKFESAYGAGKHEQKKQEQFHGWDRSTDLVIDEWWTWEDPFTTQMLKKNKADQGWVALRRSRVLEANRDRQKEEAREQTNTNRVQGIEVD